MEDLKHSLTVETPHLGPFSLLLAALEHRPEAGSGLKLYGFEIRTLSAPRLMLLPIRHSTLRLLSFSKSVRATQGRISIPGSPFLVPVLLDRAIEHTVLLLVRILSRALPCARGQPFLLASGTSSTSSSFPVERRTPHLQDLST